MINVHSLQWQHAKCAYMLWKVLWFNSVFWEFLYSTTCKKRYNFIKLLQIVYAECLNVANSSYIIGIFHTWLNSYLNLSKCNNHYLFKTYLKRSLSRQIILLKPCETKCLQCPNLPINMFVMLIFYVNMIDLIEVNRGKSKFFSGILN